MLETGTSNTPQPEKAVILKITEHGGYISSTPAQNGYGQTLLKDFKSHPEKYGENELAIKSDEPITIRIFNLGGDRLGKLTGIKKLILKKEGERIYVARVKNDEKYFNIPKAAKTAEPENPAPHPKPVPAKASVARQVPVPAESAKPALDDILNDVLQQTQEDRVKLAQPIDLSAEEMGMPAGVKRAAGSGEAGVCSPDAQANSASKPQPKKPNLTPINVDAKTEEALWESLIKLSSERKDFDKAGWALNFMAKIITPDAKFLTELVRCREHFDAALRSRIPPYEQCQIGKRVQIILHPDNNTSRDIADHLIGFFMKASNSSGFVASRHSKLLKEFADKLIDHFKLRGEEEQIGVVQKSLNLQKIERQLKSGKPALIEMGLRDARAAASTELKLAAKDSENKESRTQYAIDVVNLAIEQANKLMTGRQKADYVNASKQVVANAGRFKGDYGHQVREVQKGKVAGYDANSQGKSKPK